MNRRTGRSRIFAGWPGGRRDLLPSPGYRAPKEYQAASQAARSSSSNRELDRSQAFVQLVGPAGADNGRGDAGLLQDPGDRHRDQRLAPRLEELPQAFDGVELGLLPVTGPVQLAGLAQGEARPRGGASSERYLPERNPPASGL